MTCGRWERQNRRDVGGLLGKRIWCEFSIEFDARFRHLAFVHSSTGVEISCVCVEIGRMELLDFVLFDFAFFGLLIAVDRWAEAGVAVAFL